MCNVSFDKFVIVTAFGSFLIPMRQTYLLLCFLWNCDFAGYISIRFLISFASEILKILVEGFIIERNCGDKFG